MSPIEYHTKTASAAEIYDHLLACKDDFQPPLDKKVNVRDYAVKLAEKAVTFEAWKNQKLIGLVASYMNNIAGGTGYITNVSLLREETGNGIASRLMQMCIDYAKNLNFRDIQLEVCEESDPAIRLYQKVRFRNTGHNGNMVTMQLDLSK